MMGNTVDGQGSQVQSGTNQQVSVSATTVRSAAGSHPQGTLSIQQPPVSISKKTPLVVKIDTGITCVLNTILNIVVNINSNINQLPVSHCFVHD